MGKRKSSHRDKLPKSKDTENKGNRSGLSIQAQRFEGPIPPPAILKEYNDIVPGAAERILAMAELQGQHRRELESKVINRDSIRSSRGQVFAFIIAITIVVGGFFMIWKGKSLEGMTAIIGALTALSGVFITGKIIKNKNLKNRR